MAKRIRHQDQEAVDELKDLEERLAEVARRSPLSRWVMRNFDRLAGLVDDYGPHWGEMAKWMNERGVIGDKPVTGDALRKAFERERENKRERDEPAKPQTPPKAQPALTTSAVVRVLGEQSAVVPEQNSGSDLDSLAASLDAGRGWRPKDNKRR
jgi:hypothetical protein